MTLITWSNMLSVGVGEIDHQHQALIAIINRLAEVSESAATVADRASALAQMTAYALGHFRFEAELMRQINYAESAAHLLEHERFVDKVRMLSQRMEGGDTPAVQEFMVFLRTWLVTHILDTDRELGKALNAAGVR